MKHRPDCPWETADCAYKATHYYCPHPEHACTCPRDSIHAIPFRTPACDRHLPDNESDECPWCEIERLRAEG